VGGLACAVAAGHVLPALAGAWPPLRRPLGIEDHTASGTGYAITFDDGPHPRGTPAVLEILAAAGVQATFFLVGEQVERDPTLAGEIVAAGHGVGLHCHRHRNLLRVGPRGVREDIARAEERIAGATGRAVALYRPPYGILSACALAQAATGSRGPPRSRSAPAPPRPRGRGRCCSCTTPTTTRRRAPGGAQRRRCR